MSTFNLPVKFIFEGVVKVNASTEAEAMEIVKSGFGMTTSSGLHTNDDRIKEWEFSVHPEQVVGACKQ